MSLYRGATDRPLPGRASLSDANDQFRKAPRRKGDRGRTVKVSAETKQAYADLINERLKSHDQYGKHLPATPSKR